MQATRRIAILGVMLVCALAVLAEDVTFMSNRRHWEKLPTATLMKMGNDFMNIKNLPDSGMLCYSLIANRYNENLKGEELEQCIRATCNVGRIYSEFYHNQKEAMRYLLQSKELVEKHRYHKYMPVVFLEMGNIYWQQEGLKHNHKYGKEALEYYQAAFHKAIEIKSHKLLPLIIINMTYVAFNTKQLPQIKDEVELYNQIAIIDPNDSLAKSVCQAIISIIDNHLEQALRILKKAPVENNSIYNKSHLRIMLNDYIYMIQMQLGQDDEAFKTLTMSNELVHTEATEHIAESYALLAEYYNKQGNQTLAKNYELLWWRTSDSLSNICHANEVENIQFLHELDKMNEEQKALTLKQQHDRQMLWVVSGFLLLALVLLTLLAINRSRIKQKNRVLYENNVALLAADEQRRRLDEQEEKARIDAEAAKYGAIRMDEQSTEELWQNIIHVMEYSQEIYDENFSVARLAELIGAKPNYVSQAINQQPDWTFPTLLAHYRIREACRRMNDTARYGNYTVEGLGQSVGFTSRSYFVKLFKKHTGLTPSDYMKQRR